MVPLALAAGIVLVIAAATPGAKLACGVYAFSTVALFGISAVYHLGHWSPTVEGVLRRLDHSNIAFIIAGTYTPLAALLLSRPEATRLLWIVWLGAAGVIILRTVWLKAPRWSYVPLYVALGWVAIWFLPDFARAGGAALAWLVVAGGLAYTGGAVVYALRRPQGWPLVFGFHEIFHSLTVVGYTCHFVAVTMAATRG
jgi:hemolysin III